jgi:hypothetical protein
MRAVLAASVAWVALAAVRADAADLQRLLGDMRAALEPPAPTVRALTLQVSGESGAASEVRLGEARGSMGKAQRALFVVLAPAGLRGIAYLVQHGGPGPDVQWLYIPSIRRVRELVSQEAYTAFLNSDFTYADLGFVDVAARSRLLAAKSVDGAPALAIESVPTHPWYYGRTVTWLAPDSHLPLRRDIYDTANRLWKVERWETADVDGKPRLHRMSMQDVQMQTRSDIEVTAVRSDLPIPPELLDPAHLPVAIDSPLWKQLGGG